MDDQLHGACTKSQHIVMWVARKSSPSRSLLLEGKNMLLQYSRGTDGQAVTLGTCTQRQGQLALADIQQEKHC